MAQTRWLRYVHSGPVAQLSGSGRHWGMRRHKCTLRAHQWGRMGYRSHGSPLGTEGRHWGTRRHRCTIGAHCWGGVTGGAKGDTEGYTSAPYSTTIHSFVRSLILSLASALSRLTTGEGRVHTGRHAQPPFVARSLARSPNSLPYCKTVRSLVRQLTSRARHWGEGDNTRPPSLARLLANSRLYTGE